MPQIDFALILEFSLLFLACWCVNKALSCTVFVTGEILFDTQDFLHEGRLREHPINPDGVLGV